MIFQQNDEELVRAVVSAVAHHIDAKNWRDLRTLYAKEVTTDYSSLFGGTPTRNRGDDLIEGWRTALTPVATHHLLGPIHVRVSGDRATAHCHVRGAHFVEGAENGEIWEVLGHYIFELVRHDATFQIETMTLDTYLQIGNRNLLEEAQRVQQKKLGNK